MLSSGNAQLHQRSHVAVEERSRGTGPTSARSETVPGKCLCIVGMMGDLPERIIPITRQWSYPNACLGASRSLAKGGQVHAVTGYREQDLPIDRRST